MPRDQTRLGTWYVRARAHFISAQTQHRTLKPCLGGNASANPANAFRTLKFCMGQTHFVRSERRPRVCTVPRHILVGHKFETRSQAVYKLTLFPFFITDSINARRLTTTRGASINYGTKTVPKP